MLLGAEQTCNWVALARHKSAPHDRELVVEYASVRDLQHSRGERGASASQLTARKLTGTFTVTSATPGNDSK
jgi:hypothetical protein